MELRQLRYFAAVADVGGFARAAEQLHIGQPAVSQQIRRLERELGVRLFDRSTRHVRLTAAGTRLLPEARSVLAAAERTRRVADDLTSTHISPLRVGTGPAPGDRFYVLLEHVRLQAPEVGLRLTKMNLVNRLQGVRAGSLDAALVRDLAPQPGLELVTIWSDALIVALQSAHPLASLEELTLGDLGELPLRLAPRQNNPAFHQLVQDALGSADITPPAGPPFTRLQDTLSDIAHAAPSWTVFYPVNTPPPMPGITYRTLSPVRSTNQLAVRPNPPDAALQRFLAACAGWSPDG